MKPHTNHKPHLWHGGQPTVIYTIKITMTLWIETFRKNDPSSLVPVHLLEPLGATRL